MTLAKTPFIHGICAAPAVLPHILAHNCYVFIFSNRRQSVIGLGVAKGGYGGQNPPRNWLILFDNSKQISIKMMARRVSTAFQ